LLKNWDYELAVLWKSWKRINSSSQKKSLHQEVGCSLS
jgi:hypothetical protein